MGRVTVTNRRLKEKREALVASGFSIEIIPTSDNIRTGDMWIILSKDEIHVTHRIGSDIRYDDRALYHCLNFMEQEHSKVREIL